MIKMILKEQVNQVLCHIFSRQISRLCGTFRNQWRFSCIESEYVFYIVDYQCILVYFVKNYIKY